MIKNFLIAAALVIASPALVFSQDIFLSFDAAGNAPTTSGAVGSTGTVNIFSDQPFAFDALDLDITSSDPSVLLLTGGTAINRDFNNPFLSGNSFDSAALTVDASGASAKLFNVTVLENGVDPQTTPVSNAFVAGAGSGDGALFLAEINYEIAGSGSSDLTLSLGPQGAITLPAVVLNPTFGSATLTGEGVAVPEPSSATLLVLGAVGMVARRRRARA